MRKYFLTGLLTFLLFFSLCLILFWSTVTKPFLSDDYDVIYRVVYQKDFFIKGFFRPLSDFSIYFCSLIGGTNPVVYNVFNLLVHAGSCFILYRFCLVSDLFPKAPKSFIAWTAALLFLIYPFHLESVLWIVGRASSISNFFGFLSLLLAFSNMQLKWRYFLVCFCYFLGLASYETTFVLPAILLVFLYQPKKPVKAYVPWIVCFAVTLFLHLLLRLWLAQAFAGQYGQKMFLANAKTYLLNVFKVFGRLLLPPSANSQMLSVLFVLTVVLLAVLCFRLLRKKPESKLTFGKLFLAVLIASAIPILFGISTHTSEGDRLIYFTSFFIVLWLAFVLSLIRLNKVRNVAAFFLGTYFFIFLIQGNHDWNRAGKITRQILARVKEAQGQNKPLGLVNIPEEYDGAFIFRVGFQQALLMNGVDTGKFVVLRTLTSEEAKEINGAIEPTKKAGATVLKPNTFLCDSLITVVRPYTFDTISFRRENYPSILYWNKHDLVPLNKLR